MKVTPIASGSGSPAGSSLGQERMPADRIAAAKAVAAGQSPVRIAESDTPTDPMMRRAQRTIKMRTNASPERYLQEPASDPNAPPVDAPAPESAISDASGTANAVTEDTKPLSPQLAAIAKQRRALQVKERELADREKAYLAREQQPQGQNPDTLIARIKSEPLSVLQEYGVTYDQLTEAIMSGQSGVNPDILALQKEIKALKEGVDKTLSDKDAAAEEAVLSEMMREAATLSKEGDAYEMVRETNSLPDVRALIYKTFKTTGEVLDVEEALGLVEEDLINESLKIANIGKVKSKLAPPPEPAPQNPQLAEPKTFRTLTNRDGTSIPLGRKERAMKAFYGQK